MIERLMLTLVLLALGFAAYWAFRRYKVAQAAATASNDPILKTLRPGTPAIVYFTTPMCIPCRTQQQPALARLQEELGQGIQILKIDATEDSEAAERWGVFAAPTTFILDTTGQPRQVNHGVADSNKLKRQLSEVIPA